jgi:hypothetical protein
MQNTATTYKTTCCHNPKVHSLKEGMEQEAVMTSKQAVLEMSKTAKKPSLNG